MSAVLERVGRRRPAAGERAASRHDLAFARDVLAGLAQPRKAIASTTPHTDRARELFEAIAAAPGPDGARAETLIVAQCAGAIAAAAGRGATLIELGAGSTGKTPLLLGALEEPAACLPIDPSARRVAGSAAALRARFPGLSIVPLVADGSRLDALPAAPAGSGRRVVALDGSALAALAPQPAEALLHRLARLAGPEALLVVGADACRDPAAVLSACDGYQDSIAAFQAELLARLDRELGADLDPGAFEHEARFAADPSRLEMHLVSRRSQVIGLLGRRFDVAAGESIRTASVHKHGITGLQALARRAGWEPLQLWTDARARFAVHVLLSTG